LKNDATDEHPMGGRGRGVSVGAYKAAFRSIRAQILVAGGRGPRIAGKIYHIRCQAGVQVFQMEFDAVGAAHGIACRNPYLQKQEHEQQTTAEGFSMPQHESRLTIRSNEVKISLYSQA
jgi:hypothetical protein